jgi:hypothetical protein
MSAIFEEEKQTVGESSSLNNDALFRLVDLNYIYDNYKNALGENFNELLVLNFYKQNAASLFINPNQFFSEKQYRSKYSDVDEAVKSGHFFSGFHHWVNHGRAERRNPFPWDMDRHAYDLLGDFDLAFFVAEYAEKIPGNLNYESALRYYISSGAKEKLNPNSLFDESVYQNNYPDVVNAIKSGLFISGFHHWAVVGRFEKRSSSLPKPNFVSSLMAHQYIIGNIPSNSWNDFFDGEYYAKSLKENFDINIPPSRSFDYFMKEGVFRGDIPTPKFDESFYTAYYSDVYEAKKEGLIPSGYLHFLAIGKEEGRLPTHDLSKCLEKKLSGLTEPIFFNNVRTLELKLASPNVVVTERSSKVNVFVPSLDPDIMFGGYISLLNFLCRCVEAGYEIRFIICEDGQSNKAWFLQGIEQRKRWHSAFKSCEVINLGASGVHLFLGKNDICLAYSAWTAYIASNVASKLRAKKFVFFIQEYEAIFHENDAFQFLVDGAYRLPHVALFNTEILRIFFENRKIGVFSRKGSNKFLSYQHALADNSPDIDVISKKSCQTLLFYARPEKHAGRNLFEIGVLALKAAVRQKIFDRTWKIVGLGALGNDLDVDLGDDCTLLVRSRIPQADYERLLKEVDVGLSLMWAPHPSILPFELAKAGAICVTNEYENRPKSLLESFGFNIVAAEPTISGIVDGLREAVSRTKNIPKRIDGSKFDWPVDWDVVFTREFIEQSMKLPLET